MTYTLFNRVNSPDLHKSHERPPPGKAGWACPLRGDVRDWLAQRNPGRINENSQSKRPISGSQLKLAFVDVIVALSSVDGQDAVGALQSEPDHGADQLTAGHDNQYDADHRAGRVAPLRSRHPQKYTNRRQRQEPGQRRHRQPLSQIHHCVDHGHRLGLRVDDNLLHTVNHVMFKLHLNYFDLWWIYGRLVVPQAVLLSRP